MGAGERSGRGLRKSKQGLKFIVKAPRETPSVLLHGSPESSDWYRTLLPGLQERRSPPLVKETPHLRKGIRQPHPTAIHSVSRARVNFYLTCISIVPRVGGRKGVGGESWGKGMAVSVTLGSQSPRAGSRSPSGLSEKAGLDPDFLNTTLSTDHEVIHRNRSKTSGVRKPGA